MKNPIRFLKQLRRKVMFQGSAQFWEENYAKGGTSGFGSYDAFGKHKADIINDFVKKNKVNTVLEFGCGDGNQLSMYAFSRIAYVGLDVSGTAVDMCSKQFAGDKHKSFMKYDTMHFYDFSGQFKADLVLSMDVIGHIVEREIWKKYIDNAVKAAGKFLIIHDISEDRYRVEAPHCRPRDFVKYILRSYPELSYLKINNELKDDGTAFHVFKR